MVCDLLQKIELFHAAGTQMFPPHGPEIVKTFYDILTVLDSKGLALLAFDGIVVAATTFAAEKGGVFRRRGTARWLAILIIILSLTAAALCLLVSEISYSFTARLPTDLISPMRSRGFRLWSIGAPNIIKSPGGAR